LKRIPFFPRKLSRTKESGEADTEGCMHVEAVGVDEVLFELVGDANEDFLREGKTLSCGLVVQPFSPAQDALDDWVFELFEGEAVFEVVVAESAEVISYSVDFDSGEEAGDPVGNCFESAGEWGVAV